MGAQTHSDWLIDQMALALRVDLNALLGRITRCSADPHVRARLAIASASYMFGAACAAQHNATPMDKMIIAGAITADMVDALEHGAPGCVGPIG